MSLSSLFAELGQTSGDVARAAQVDAALFVRVDAGQQPLPRFVAVRIAAFLGVHVSSVITTVPSWTASTGPIAARPVPADPLLGQRYELVPIAPYSPPKPTAAPTSTTIVGGS